MSEAACLVTPTAEATCQDPDAKEARRQSLFHDQRGGAEVQHPPADAAAVRREGLLKPSRTEGNTRLYSEDDLEQLETILSLTRDLGVNLAGVEIILNMRGKIEAMQLEVNEFMDFVKRELSRGLGDWEQRLGTPWSSRRPPIW